MSVIFFEGFNSSALDSNFWTVSYGAWTSGISEPRVSPGGALGGNVPFANIYLSNIGTHTNKKLYVGIGIKNLASFSGNDAPYKFLTFRDGATTKFLLQTAQQDGITNPGGVFDVELVDADGTTVLGSWSVEYDQSGTWYSTKAYWSNSWLFLELEIDMTSTPNKLTMRKNGLIWNTTDDAAYVEFPTALASLSRLDLAAQIPNSYGIFTRFDDLYICDNSGTTANTWLGVDSVVYPLSLNESAPEVDEWTKYAPNWPNIALNTNDGDSSYIRTGTVNKKQLYPITPVTPAIPNASVGGVRITSVARNSNLPSAYRHLYRAPDTTEHELSAKFDLTAPQYTTSASFLLVNPKTNAAWTLSDLNSGFWGVKSVTPT